MKLNDYSQNLPARVAVIQIFAILLLTVLGARMYYMQIVKGDYYQKKASDQTQVAMGNIEVDLARRLASKWSEKNL